MMQKLLRTDSYIYYDTKEIRLRDKVTKDMTCAYDTKFLFLKYFKNKNLVS